jgi:hypothetical protein
MCFLVEVRNREEAGEGVTESKRNNKRCTGDFLKKNSSHTLYVGLGPSSRLQQGRRDSPFR